MLRKTIKTIHRLRIYVLCLLIIGFFYYLGANPIRVGKYIGARFGSAVGMSTSVPENPFNSLALQLKEKEDRLAQREKVLDEREKNLAQTSNSTANLPLLILGIGTSILFILVLVNYYLDFKRRKTGSAGLSGKIGGTPNRTF